MLACRAVFNGALIKLRNRFVFFIVVYFTRFFLDFLFRFFYLL